MLLNNKKSVCCSPTNQENSQLLAKWSIWYQVSKLLFGSIMAWNDFFKQQLYIFSLLNL